MLRYYHILWALIKAHAVLSLKVMRGRMDLAPGTDGTAAVPAVLVAEAPPERAKTPLLSFLVIFGVT